MLKQEELIPTRDSLLSRLKNREDQDSWQDFFDTYWKLVYGVAIKAGLTEQEAQEAVQETVITVARRIPEFKYDPAVCSFKTWLLNLTRWRITDQLRKRRPELVGFHRSSSDTARTATIDRIPDPASVDLDTVWEKQWEEHLLAAAIGKVKRRVKPEQYQMFDLCVFKQWPIKKIASQLGVSQGRVYLARHRIAAMLKQEVKLLEKKLT
jgi:RNA polymerase sigma-70 factor (ECF subfamily)